MDALMKAIEDINRRLTIQLEWALWADVTDPWTAGWRVYGARLSRKRKRR